MSAASVSGQQTATRRVNSRDLFQQMREVEIEHEGRIYRLRLTQLNKLILTA
jgi:hemin uptake protein HemP